MSDLIKKYRKLNWPFMRAFGPCDEQAFFEELLTKIDDLEKRVKKLEAKDKDDLK